MSEEPEWKKDQARALAAETLDDFLEVLEEVVEKKKAAEAKKGE